MCDHLTQAPCTLDEYGEEEQDDCDEEEGDYSEDDKEHVTKYVMKDGGRSVF